MDSEPHASQMNRAVAGVCPEKRPRPAVVATIALICVLVFVVLIGSFLPTPAILGVDSIGFAVFFTQALYSPRSWRTALEWAVGVISVALLARQGFLLDELIGDHFQGEAVHGYSSAKAIRVLSFVANPAILVAIIGVMVMHWQSARDRGVPRRSETGMPAVGQSFNETVRPPERMQLSFCDVLILTFLTALTALVYKEPLPGVVIAGLLIAGLPWAITALIYGDAPWRPFFLGATTVLLPLAILGTAALLGEPDAGNLLSVTGQSVAVDWLLTGWTAAVACGLAALAAKGLIAPPLSVPPRTRWPRGSDPATPFIHMLSPRMLLPAAVWAGLIVGNGFPFVPRGVSLFLVLAGPLAAIPFFRYGDSDVRVFALGLVTAPAAGVLFVLWDFAGGDFDWLLPSFHNDLLVGLTLPIMTNNERLSPAQQLMLMWGVSVAVGLTCIGVRRWAFCSQSETKRGRESFRS
jgi:hypothetical protein